MSESFAELFEQSLAVTQLQPVTIVTGTVVASATAEDLYQSVTMAADRARAAVDRRVTKLHRRHGSEAERRPPDDGPEAA